MVINRQRGFTLIELMIAIAIIGLMMAMIVPMMQRRPGYERKQFVARLNSVVQFAWQQAIVTRATHRVLLNIKERTATVERNTTPSPLNKQLTFEPSKDLMAHMSWPDSIILRSVIIEGFDELKRFAGRATDTVWFYIVPDGMTQQVTINGVDKNDMVDNRPWHFGLVLNPFMAQFKEYDTFQK